MNVVVCVKQIPDPADPGALNPDHTLKRDGKLSAEETREFLRKELNHALCEHPLLIERPYQKEVYSAELWDMLTAFVHLELEALRNTALRPLHFEYAFGTGDSPDGASVREPVASSAHQHMQRQEGIRWNVAFS